MGWNKDIEVGRLVPSALNPRQSMSGLEDLAKSLDEHGLLQALVVRRLPTDKPGQVRRACILYQLQDNPALELTVHSTVERLAAGGHSCVNEQARGALRHLERTGLIECVADEPMKTYRVTQAGLDYDVAQVEGEEFEIICGHRRHRAAQLAGIAKLECKIVTMSDGEALEAMLIENSAREDVPPLEESDALMRLIGMGANVDDLRDRMGRSAKWVRDRVAIAELVEEGRSALAATKMTLGAAVALAKLGAERQREIMQRIGFLERINLASIQRAIRGYHLKHAPWGLNDATLGGRGACQGCLMQSGQEPDLWGQPGQDAACIDSGCWSTKFANLRERLEADGRMIDRDERFIGFDHRIGLGDAPDETWRKHLEGLQPMYTPIGNSDLREVIAVDDAIAHLKASGKADLAEALAERAYPRKVDDGPQGREVPSTKAIKTALGDLVDAVTEDPSVATSRRSTILAAVLASMGSKVVSKIEKRRGVTLDEVYLDEIGPRGREALLVELSVLQSIEDSRAKHGSGLMDGDVWPSLLQAYGIEVPAHTMAD